MAPKPKPKTLRLRLCKASIQSIGYYDATVTAFNLDDHPHLDTPAGWEIFEKAICKAFDVRHFLHVPRFHGLGGCKDKVDMVQGVDSKSVHRVCFGRRDQEAAGAEGDAGREEEEEEAEYDLDEYDPFSFEQPGGPEGSENEEKREDGSASHDHDQPPAPPDPQTNPIHRTCPSCGYVQFASDLARTTRTADYGGNGCRMTSTSSAP